MKQKILSGRAFLINDSTNVYRKDGEFLMLDKENTISHQIFNIADEYIEIRKYWNGVRMEGKIFYDKLIFVKNG